MHRDGYHDLHELVIHLGHQRWAAPPSSSHEEPDNFSTLRNVLNPTPSGCSSTERSGVRNEREATNTPAGNGAARERTKERGLWFTVALVATLVAAIVPSARAATTVRTWGVDITAELGFGATSNSLTPVQVSGMGPGSNVIAIAAGGLYALALKSDGSLWAWGHGGDGELGYGIFAGATTPVQVSGMGPGSGVVAIAAGTSHSLALKGDGSLWAWGYNSDGQLGDGTLGAQADKSTPVQVSGMGPGSRVVAIAAGPFHTLALKSDGSIWAWGRNIEGELGDGKYAGQVTPVQVSGMGPGSGVIAIAAGTYHSLALKKDGSVWGWGGNYRGQLGSGGTSVERTPVQVSGMGPGSGVVAIAAGTAHSLALKSDGSLWAWGYNSDGQLGDGTQGAQADKSTPVQVSGMGPGSGLVSIVASDASSLALRSDGSVWAWGNNSQGELGDGTTTPRPRPVQAMRQTPAGAKPLRARAIAAAWAHSLAIALERPVVFDHDFTGDARADLGVAFSQYNPQSTPPFTWSIKAIGSFNYGLEGDVPVPGDYDGDGLAQAAVWRPSTGQWWISSLKAPLVFGKQGDIPVPADYTDAGKLSVAVWRPSTGEWFTNPNAIYLPRRGPISWGQPGDIPVPGDYDGDGKADIAVWRPSTGQWLIRGQAPVQWGTSGDIPVPADYDGDGRTDIAVWRPSTGQWLIRGQAPVQWGAGSSGSLFVGGDIPVPADYDGDGRADLIVFRPSTQEWWVSLSTVSGVHKPLPPIPWSWKPSVFLLRYVVPL
jgi:alpha-tubulin suppressor-like RCC1 family protein